METRCTRANYRISTIEITKRSCRRSSTSKPFSSFHAGAVVNRQQREKPGPAGLFHAGEFCSGPSSSCGHRMHIQRASPVSENPRPSSISPLPVTGQPRPLWRKCLEDLFSFATVTFSIVGMMLRRINARCGSDRNRGDFHYLAFRQMAWYVRSVEQPNRLQLKDYTCPSSVSHGSWQFASLS